MYSKEQNIDVNNCQIKQWCDWLQGDLSQQINDIIYQRSAFKSWNDILEKANRNSGLFGEWVNINYLTSLAVEIRRMYDKSKKKQTRSLWKLLTDIQKNIHLLTHEWWASRYSASSLKSYLDDDHFKQYLQEFNDFSCEIGHLDPKIVDKDKIILDQVAKKVKPYVDKYIAHLDADRKSSGLTVRGLHDAADLVCEVYYRWKYLICSVNPSVPSVGAWENAFTESWITKEQALVIADRRGDEAKELEERFNSKLLGKVHSPAIPRPF